MTGFIVAALIVVGGIVLYALRRMFRHGGRITKYFENAVTVYIWLGEEDARIAAVTAAKVAAKRQRKLMAGYLKLHAELSEISIIPEAQESIQTLRELIDDIEAKEWSIRDIMKAKDKLEASNPEYLRALNRADSGIFPRKYPRLFAAKSIRETAAIAKKMQSS
ncbi:MAG: hypothetical protein G01um101438_339 [Parcubacteria group bacterium Gr01-1014_38]|nr:MAG: hypothetical protein G01um101438_339 [Parcubacteria group bacterium Gr01-1014_38]